MQSPRNYELSVESIDGYEVEFILDDVIHYGEFTINWDGNIPQVLLLNIFTEEDDDLRDILDAQVIEEVEVYIEDCGNTLEWDMDKLGALEDYYYDIHRERGL